MKEQLHACLSESARRQVAVPSGLKPRRDVSLPNPSLKAGVSDGLIRIGF